MDQELIAYFEERFRESSRQMEALRGQVEGYRDESSRQMEALRGQVEGYRDETSRQIEGLRVEIGTFRQETISRFEQVDEAIRDNKDEIRHTQVIVEGVRSDLQGVAEGVMAANERIDALREETNQKVGEVHAFVRMSYTDMGKRVHSLEEWRTQVGKAPAAAVRKKSGKKS